LADKRINPALDDECLNLIETSPPNTADGTQTSVRYPCSEASPEAATTTPAATIAKHDARATPTISKRPGSPIPEITRRLCAKCLDDDEMPRQVRRLGTRP
jgi:hypothetical protein